MDAEIRKAGVSDIETIHLLANKIWPEVYDYMISKDQINYMLELIYSTLALHEQITEKKHQFVIYYQEDIPLAFASYSPKSITEPTTIRLHKIYVSANLHGQGVGKLLLNYIEAEMTRAGATALELNVNKTNKAIGFYKKNGFEILYPEVIDIGGGYVMDDYVMKKDL